MQSYFTPRCSCEHTITINKSSFICTLVPVSDGEDAVIKLNALRKKYTDATHNCYAYISSNDGNEARFSDDGEPSGTAGQPILSVLKSRNIRMVLAVVTRYFGGIKLGAGGLVSAYTASVSEALDNADITEMVYSQGIEIKADYGNGEAVRKQLLKESIKIESTDYTDSVVIKLWIKDGEQEGLLQRLTQLTAGKAEINFLEKRYESYDSGGKKG